MASRTTSLLFLSIALASVWLVAVVPRTKAQHFVKCKTSENCQGIQCQIGQGITCKDSVCVCVPNTKTGSSGHEKKKAQWPCDWSEDCDKHLKCPVGLPLCMEGICDCLTG
ncbi:PREDICTED: putative defensin-like protein 298 [Tarenaya hassleriana]|uniref:putative defensin-like protein 298 n=1 Tax=Tarenaya hassleriana TaxID=28532 RepID=UPI00053C8D67|nr:PREDICTED: putative defensin-like protein 298 [Tarenaya hassleriana]